MAKKITAAELLGTGVVSAYKLTATGKNDAIVLVIGTSDKSYVVPCIKNKIGAVAYIDPSLDDETALAVTNIVEVVTTANPWKAPSFHAMAMEAPAFDKTVYGFLAASGCVENEDAQEILEKNGYKIVKKELKTSFKKRNYSDLMKDEVNQRIYKKNAEDLAKCGATYESLSTEIKVAYESVENGSSGGIIFEGPTGTGKSYAAMILAHKAGAPLLNLQITYGTTIEDLVGSFIPNADGGEAKWKLVMGPLLKAYVYGYPIVIEEINYGQPGVNAKLNEFTDGTPRVTINGIVYEKHPNFVVYMTMNPGYEGTEVLNVALKNRFSKVNVPALTKAEFTERAMAYSKGLGHELSKEFFNQLYEFAGTIEKAASGSQWHENVKFSIRNAQRLCETILCKARSLEEFEAAIATQYLNDLSCDNDNSVALEKYKSQAEVKAQIAAIYKFYDFAEAKSAKVTKTFDDIFGDVVSYADSKDHEDKIDAMVSGLFDDFE